MQERLEMALEIRGSLEIAYTTEYLKFMKCYFRVFSEILLQITKPQFVENSEHKLRNVVLEVLSRLPHNEVLRPFVQDLLMVSMQVLTTDNEENGILCIRIILDIGNNYRPPTLKNQAQLLVDFVYKIYKNFSLTVSHFFGCGASGVKDTSSMDITYPDQVDVDPARCGGELSPSTRSLKIVVECPILVMFLFRLYNCLLQSNIPHLIPLMVAAISNPGPEIYGPHLGKHYINLKEAQAKVRIPVNNVSKLHCTWSLL